MNNKVNIKIKAALTLLTAFITTPIHMVYAETTTEPPSVTPALLHQLQNGGFVIYFRHASTEVIDGDRGPEDIAKCETQRNLSTVGKAQAKQIGDAFHKLKIPVGTILSSPFCRCKETALLAFGRFEVDNNLYFAINTHETERKQLTTTLRQMLSTPPTPGTNTVLVSHTANLREATGFWPKPEGTAYVFRPLPGGAEPVAKILPDEWRHFVSKF